jgi:hypothetical protein
MPHSAVRKGYRTPRRGPLVSHGHYLPDRWTGKVELTLTAERRHPLVLGSGWIDARIEEVVVQRGERRKIAGRWVKKEHITRQDLVAASDIVRRGADGQPVLPGSGLKGALRQVYELLTPSCEPGQTGACTVDTRDAAPQVCPACLLFGAPGYAGRLRFQEALPERVEVKRVLVPLGWSHKEGRLDGTYRLYRSSRDPEREEQETTWAAWGEFRSELVVTNASEDELGLLLAALGVGWNGPGPDLRVGGKKYHGFGAVGVALGRSIRIRPERRVLDADATRRWAEALARDALARDPTRETLWRRLHQVLADTGVRP